jgi:hypothetical protein
MKVTERDVDTYTDGLCWSLAWEISNMTGLPIATAGSPVWGWSHVLVHIGRNQYLDITGINTKKNLRDWWGEKVVIVGTFPTFEEYTNSLCGLMGFSQKDTQHNRTQVLAGHLIEKYNLLETYINV